MLDSLPVAIAAFIVAALIIIFAGTKLARLADQLADRTGLGEALTGVLLLGLSTSLPGLIASIVPALDGRASMAVSNAVGGIAIQTVFLVIADATCSRANLEHAAASLGNVFQGILLMALLAMAMVAGLHPFANDWFLHPASILIVLAFLIGQRIVSRMQDTPMWEPVQTKETKEDEPEKESQRQDLAPMVGRFVLLAAVTGACGWVLAQAGFVMIDRGGLEGGLVGALFTATASSLPELVTSIAAVRQGAFTLAISGVIGGNAFDTLFLVASDAAYTGGSIYHAAATEDLLLMGITLVMTAVLTGGLLVRQKQGPGNVGWEGILILFFYALAVLLRF